MVVLQVCSWEWVWSDQPDWVIMSIRDASRVNKLIHKAGTITGQNLETSESMVDKRTVNKLLSITDNTLKLCACLRVTIIFSNIPNVNPRNSQSPWQLQKGPKCWPERSRRWQSGRCLWQLSLWSQPWPGEKCLHTLHQYLAKRHEKLSS